MNRRLENIIEEVCAMTLDDSLSDDAVVASMQIHLSLAALSAAGGGCVCGSPKSHRKAVERLFDISLARSRDLTSAARRSRMASVLYAILRLPATPFDDRRHDICLGRSFAVMDEWRDANKGHENRKNLERRGADERTAEYDVLRCTIEAFACAVAEDKMADDDFRRLKLRIGEWAAAMNDNGCWNGLSVGESLQRLDIMAQFAEIHGDSESTRCVARARRGLRSAADRLDGIDSIDNLDSIDGFDGLDGQRFYYMYRLFAGGAGFDDDRCAEALSELSFRLAASPQCPSDERLWHMAVCIDRATSKMLGEIDRSCLPHSA